MDGTHLDKAQLWVSFSKYILLRSRCIDIRDIKQQFCADSQA